MSEELDKNVGEDNTMSGEFKVYCYKPIVEKNTSRKYIILASMF